MKRYEVTAVGTALLYGENVDRRDELAAKLDEFCGDSVWSVTFQFVDGHGEVAVTCDVEADGPEAAFRVVANTLGRVFDEFGPNIWSGSAKAYDEDEEYHS